MKTIKAFCSRDDFIDNNQNIISNVFELSDKSNSYAKDKQTYYYNTNPVYSLKVFNSSGGILTQNEASTVISFIDYFIQFASTNINMVGQQLQVNAVAAYNNSYPTTEVTNFSMVNVITEQNIRTAEYYYFTIDDIECMIWVSDGLFSILYPDYIVDKIMPVANFNTIINTPSSFITELDNFDLVEFTNRIDLAKSEYPTTNTRVVNVPYVVPNTTVTKNCYFGFNIYGEQGNYIDLIKLELYEYLHTVVGLSQIQIESIFPSLLEINEFFITPRWDKIGISSQVGQSAIYSQISKSYVETFDIDKFVPMFPNQHLQDQTYNVPAVYNNLLIQVTNGYYTEHQFKDFLLYYSDILSLASSQPDFSRMSSRTQNFLIILNTTLSLSNSDTFLELFNKLINNNLSLTYKLRVRNGITYLTTRFEDHVYYSIPKYEFIRVNV